MPNDDEQEEASIGGQRKSKTKKNKTTPPEKHPKSLHSEVQQLHPHNLKEDSIARSIGNSLAFLLEKLGNFLGALFSKILASKKSDKGGTNNELQASDTRTSTLPYTAPQTNQTTTSHMNPNTFNAIGELSGRLDDMTSYPRTNTMTEQKTPNTPTSPQNNVPTTRSNSSSKPKPKRK